jgi:hypothetical protein
MRTGCALTAAMIGAVAVLAASPARALVRTATDEDEVNTIRRRSPKAAELLERGEAQALVGGVDAADALFKQAEVEVPTGSILWRRDCEMLTILGHRDDAIRACNVATQTLHSPLNFRAGIRALVTGPEPPKSMDLFVALTLEASQRRRLYGAESLLAATDCDIAESVGDGNMLQECTAELESTAPNAPETKRALAFLAGRCPPWRFWAGWSVILAAVAATAWDALASARRRRVTVAKAVAAGVLAWAALSTHATAAHAQVSENAPPNPGAMLSKWAVNEDDPVSSIPSDKDKNADPLQFGYWIQDLIMKAQHASKHGDHAKSAKLWMALGVAVPDRAVSFGNACEEYEAMGNHDMAIDACGQALLREGLTVNDYTRFVNVVIAKPGPLNAKETAALAQVLDHMKADDASRAIAIDLECEVGVRTSNVKQLKDCTTVLNATAPDDAKTISYKWALAVLENKFIEARKLVAQAKAKGVEGAGLENMERMTSESARQYWTRMLLWLGAFAALLAGVGFGGRLVLGARRRDPQLA